MTQIHIIDIHIHGIGGYDSRSTLPEHFLRVAEILAGFGLSAFLPTLYPAPIKAMRQSLQAIKDAMTLQASDWDGKSAKILGANLEGPFINPSKCGALNSMAFLPAKLEHFDALIEGFEDIVKIITIAPELDDAIALIKHVSSKGYIVSLGHSLATLKQAQAGFDAGARLVTHTFNAMSGLHHREPGLAGFALMHPEIYIELIADYWHLHPKVIELIFKVKPHDKIIIVSDMVKESTPARHGYGLCDTHGRLIGGNMTLTEVAVRLVDEGFDKEAVYGCISANPARLLGIK